jgi:uncharacterized membrane protein
MTTTCPSCGAALPQAAVRFCLACGHQLPSADETTAPPPAAAPRPPQRPRPGRTRPARRRRSVIIALVILVVLAGGGAGTYVLLRHKTSAATETSHSQKDATSPTAQTPASPATPATEQDQLTQFLPAVQGSVVARTLVTTAVPQVGACTMTPATGITQLQQAITDRQNVLAMMSGLPVSAIPGGQAMRTDLGNVLQLSITADRDFIGWMQDPQTTQNCPASTTQDADYTAGLQASTQAMQAKQQFLALWNPLAQQFGQPTYTTANI